MELAEATRPKTLRIEEANDGLWLSHFNLILGGYDELANCPNSKQHEMIAKALSKRSLLESTFHIPSYSNFSHQWPADQTATLASLARFDKAHGTQLAPDAINKWRNYIEQHAIDSKLGLPWSEVTGKYENRVTIIGAY